MFSLETIGAVISLSAMEVVLGIDNVIFIAIIVSRIPAEKRERIRRIGIAIALFFRIGLLSTLKWMMGLIRPLFVLPVIDRPISGRDLILIGGGLFLIAKSGSEIHEKVEGQEEEAGGLKRAPTSTFAIIAQIIVIDIIFSLDSVITAVGMANQLWVMIAAMVVAVGIMMLFAGSVGDFVDRHPTVKVLALSFLILIGVMLVADGFGQHISKGFVYTAMAFSLVVEMLNMRMRKKVPVADGGKAYEAEPKPSADT